jgi:hypothetical protein
VRLKSRKTVLFLLGLALLVTLGIGLLIASVPRSQLFTELSDYDRVRGSLSTHPALAAFPPRSTPLPPGSMFRALIVPLQGEDHIWLYVPGSGAASAPPPALTGVPEPHMLDTARTALRELAPNAEFAAPTAATTLLYQQESTFSLLWTDPATGDRLYVARLD